MIMADKLKKHEPRSFNRCYVLLQTVKISEMRLQQQHRVFSVNNYSEITNESVDTW